MSAIALLSSLLLAFVLSVNAQTEDVRQLIYFDGRGRAEQFRLFFADQQIQYEDVRLTWEQFLVIKPKLPWGHLPVFNITYRNANGSKWLADTAAMNVWIGRKTGLWPKDVRGSVREEILLAYSGASEDLRVQKNDVMGTGWFNATPASQAQFLPLFNDWLYYFERQLADNSLPYLLGNGFTPVDCRVWDVINQCVTSMTLYPNVFANFPLTNSFYNNVAVRPNIAAYLKIRQ